MAVSVASRRIEGLSSLSEHGRHTLKFVEDGSAWLDWAIQTHRALYRFEDEQGLVEGVQEGLHASRFLLLRTLGLMVSPLTLMTLDLAELRILARAEKAHADPDLVAEAKDVLQKRGLATQADLRDGANLLTKLNLDPAKLPLFQNMTLDDRLEILALARDPHYPRRPGPTAARRRRGRR